MRGRFVIRRLHGAAALSLLLHGAILAAFWQGSNGPASEGSGAAEATLAVAIVAATGDPARGGEPIAVEPGPVLAAVDAAAPTGSQPSGATQTVRVEARPLSAAVPARDAAPGSEVSLAVALPPAPELKPVGTGEPASTTAAPARLAQSQNSSRSLAEAKEPEPPVADAFASLSAGSDESPSFQTASLRVDGQPGLPGGQGAMLASLSAGPSASGPRFDLASLGNRPPKYPELARRRGQEGRTLLQVEVSASGRPLNVEIAESSGHALLDEAALEAVARWRFQPAQRSGAAVAGTVEVPILFRLE